MRLVSFCICFSEFVISLYCFVFFFFKRKTAYEMRISDWSSDVCSSDLDLVIIVGSALVLSGAVQRSGVIESAQALVSRRVKRVSTQLVVLTASVGFASALVKNVGALAMLMPSAFQMAKKNKTPPSVFLMPMSFAALLGGLMTLVGTSPNIIVSRVREDMLGKPFGMFDYTPVGLCLLLMGLEIGRAHV